MVSDCHVKKFLAGLDIVRSINDQEGWNRDNSAFFFYRKKKYKSMEDAAYEYAVQIKPFFLVLKWMSADKAYITRHGTRWAIISRHEGMLKAFRAAMFPHIIGK